MSRADGPVLAMNLAQTINAALLKHMDAGNVVMGQNIGEGLGGTVPQHHNLLTLPTSDCSNAGVACGYALAGKRPVFVHRFQGLAKVGIWPVLEYAAKSKAIWGAPCPVFVRAVATEGLIGPVCSGAQHGLAMRYPGIKVVAPMTPAEWTECWEEFLAGDDPVYCSEWRSSWKLTDDTGYGEFDWTDPGISRIAVVSIGAARLAAMKAERIHPFDNQFLYRLKPFYLNEKNIDVINYYGKALVIDCEPQMCGTAEHVAMELHRLTGARVEVLGLADKVAGFSEESDVLTPCVEEIVAAVRRMEQL